MTYPLSNSQEHHDAAKIRQGTQALLSALWSEHEQRLLALKERGLNVAPPPEQPMPPPVIRGHRQPAWPDCPPHLRDRYLTLARRIGGWNARARLEAA